jgi:hypothetical protein
MVDAVQRAHIVRFCLYLGTSSSLPDVSPTRKEAGAGVTFLSTSVTPVGLCLASEVVALATTVRP